MTYIKLMKNSVERQKNFTQSNKVRQNKLKGGMIYEKINKKSRKSCRKNEK